MNRIEVNVTTGERKVIELSAEEALEATERTEAEKADPLRKISLVEFECRMTRFQRDLAIAALPQGHYWREKAESAETAIAALRA